MRRKAAEIARLPGVNRSSRSFSLQKQSNPSGGLKDLEVERLVILGLQGGPAGWAVRDASGRVLDSEAGPAVLGGPGTEALVVRKPGLRLANDWSIQLVPRGKTDL